MALPQLRTSRCDQHEASSKLASLSFTRRAGTFGCPRALRHSDSTSKSLMSRSVNEAGKVRIALDIVGYSADS